MTPLGLAWAGAATLLAPALRVMLWRRQRRGKELAGRLAERRGIDATPRPAGKLLWLHAASVGEAMSLLPVLSALAAGSPASVLLTTGTVTSARLLAQRLPELGLDRRVLHRFVPLDVPAWVGRFLDHWRPDLAGLVESELWPNLIAACARRRIPLVLVNGRMSARSARGWARAPGLARAVLGAFDRVLAQSPADAARLAALGASRVATLGNLKFAAPALPADPAELVRLRAVLGGRPVWLAASTHPGEEPIVVAAHRALALLHPGLLTIIAPRHPDRGPAVAALAPGLDVRRRAAGEDPPPGGIWIADTLGELGLLYRLAGVVLVGRSLVPPGGGQNPLEPARLDCAIATGPHTGNFTDIMAELHAAGGLTRVDAGSLASFAGGMLAYPANRDAAAAAALAVVSRHSDLPERVAETLLELAR